MGEKMKRGLGKGLGALIGDAYEKEGTRLLEVDILSVDVNKNQPREEFDEEKLNELAESIAVQGILQPIVVSEAGGRYMIVAGERRFRAAKRAGLRKVPVVVGEFTQKEILELSLIENIQREDLNVMEQAKALHRLAKEYNLTQEEVAKRMGKPRSAIANLMRLMSLPEDVKDMLRDGSLTYGHAKCLMGLTNGEVMAKAAKAVERDALSVRQTEKLVARLKTGVPEKKKAEPVEAPVEIKSAEDELTEALETKVRIQGGYGGGKIVIEYYSKEHLEQLYDSILSIRQDGGRDEALL